MSISRAADLVGVLLDAPVSTGFTGGLVKRVADRLAGFENALKNALRAAPVLHHDETPARASPPTMTIGCCMSTPPAPAGWSLRRR